MRKYLVLIVLFWSISIPLLAQGEIDEQKRAMFRDESSYAGFLNSNGFGLNYRYGFWRNAWNQFILDGDFSYVKHSKEVKTTVGNSFRVEDAKTSAEEDRKMKVDGASGPNKSVKEIS